MPATSQALRVGRESAATAGRSREKTAVRRRGAWSAGTNLLVQQTRGNYDVGSPGPPVEEGRDGQRRRRENREHKKRKRGHFDGAAFF